MPFQLKEYWLGSGEHHWQDPSGTWFSESWVPSFILTLKTQPQSEPKVQYNGQLMAVGSVTVSGLTVTLAAPNDFVTVPDALDRIDVEFDW